MTSFALIARVLLIALALSILHLPNMTFARPEKDPIKMFSIEWGRGKGKFQYKESELGFERDTYPRKYVRDRKGNFYFVESLPTLGLSKFSSDGAPIIRTEVRQFMQALTNEDIVTPQELFLRPDDSVAILLRVNLASEHREEMHLIYLTPDGAFIRETFFRNFIFKAFARDSSSFLDSEGYLWTLLDGGGCNVYAPSGSLASSLNIYGSFVDAEGRLYSISAPIRAYDRSGAIVGTLKSDGPSPPEEVDGVIQSGYLFTRNNSESIRRDDIYEIPRTLDLYRFDLKLGKLTFAGTLVLPSSRYRVLDRPYSTVERTELYEDRVVSDDSGYIYFLGRSPKECWMVKMLAMLK